MFHKIIYYQVSLTTYHWIMALHIIAIVSWFAGLFNLSRLFVYHAATTDQSTSDAFKTMEYKLNYYITHPAMTVVLITGILLMHFYFIRHQLVPAWLLTKLGLVALLLFYQIRCGYHLRLFKNDSNHYSQRYFHYFNFIPLLLIIGIVMLAVVKPFSGGWSGINF